MTVYLPMLTDDELILHAANRPALTDLERELCKRLTEAMCHVPDEETI